MEYIVILIAFFADIIFSDPKWLRFHPTRCIGYISLKLERLMYRPSKLAGILHLLGVVVIVLLGLFVIRSLIKTYFGNNWVILFDIFIFYSAICGRGLATEAKKVLVCLNKEDINSARINLANIVSRDVNKLNNSQIIRATIETVAENTTDAIISPILYMLLGGVFLCTFHKIINTQDSLVGYKDARYSKFGWAAARLDDLLNFVPAKLSIVFITLSAFILKLNWRDAFKYSFIYPTTNSEIPQSAYAGALGIYLGGDINFYRGLEVKKKMLGTKNLSKKIELSDISSAIKLMFVTYFMSIFCLLLLKFLLINVFSLLFIK